ncbi:uncharacterized protein WM277_012087 isoform 1-T3 [Molossus nigricans]
MQSRGEALALGKICFGVFSRAGVCEEEDFVNTAQHASHGGAESWQGGSVPGRDQPLSPARAELRKAAPCSPARPSSQGRVELRHQSMGSSLQPPGTQCWRQNFSNNGQDKPHPECVALAKAERRLVAFWRFRMTSRWRLR